VFDATCAAGCFDVETLDRILKDEFEMAGFLVLDLDLLSPESLVMR